MTLTHQTLSKTQTLWSLWQINVEATQGKVEEKEREIQNPNIYIGHSSISDCANETHLSSSGLLGNRSRIWEDLLIYIHCLSKQQPL